jgi:two-component system response regulator FixJ
MFDNTFIYLVDPDPMMRDGISGVASAMGVKTDFYDNAEGFLQSYLADATGCVVSEFRLLGMSGLALQESLNKAGCRLPILFVTAFAETPLTVRAIKAGAITVLEKPFSRQDLWDSLRTALDMDFQTRRIDAKHTQLKTRLARINPKERQVLDLMIAGKSNKQIASQLWVSVRTVEARRHQIFKKTGAESVAELVRIILEAGDYAPSIR